MFLTLRDGIVGRLSEQVVAGFRSVRDPPTRRRVVKRPHLLNNSVHTTEQDTR